MTSQTPSNEPHSIACESEHRSLLGAYALEAVSPSERGPIERHLKNCSACSHELALLASVASELALTLRPQALSDEFSARLVDELPDKTRRSRTWRVSTSVAAAAVLVAALVGGIVVLDSDSATDLARVTQAASVTFPFLPEGDLVAHGTLYIADGEAAVVIDDMPALGQDEVYQLWGVYDGAPTSIALLSPQQGRIVSVFPDNGDTKTFAITTEPAQGSKAPTSAILISATVSG